MRQQVIPALKIVTQNNKKIIGVESRNLAIIVRVRILTLQAKSQRHRVPSGYWMNPLIRSSLQLHAQAHQLVLILAQEIQEAHKLHNLSQSCKCSSNRKAQTYPALKTAQSVQRRQPPALQASTF